MKISFSKYIFEVGELNKCFRGEIQLDSVSVAPAAADHIAQVHCAGRASLPVPGSPVVVVVRVRRAAGAGEGVVMVRGFEIRPKNVPRSICFVYIDKIEDLFQIQVHAQ